MVCHLPLIHLQLLLGADFETFQYSKNLLSFQFPKLYADSILSLIEVANAESYSITNTEF